MAESVDQIRADVDRHLDAIGQVAELSDDRYHRTHERFEAASDQRHRILAWFSRFIGSAAGPTARQAPNLLSVGCGGGVMDRRIADVVARSTGPVGVTGVDPNSQHITAFAAAFDGSPHRISTVSGGFETFESDQRFDLVYFLHCLYYFPAIESALADAARRLRPGGTVVVLQAPNDALNHLADRVWRKQFDRSAWYSDDVLWVLQSMKGQASCERIDAHVDVTPCFDPHDPDGVELLDFIVQADTRGFSNEFRALLRDSLHAICRREGDRLLASHPVDVLVYRPN